MNEITTIKIHVAIYILEIEKYPFNLRKISLLFIKMIVRAIINVRALDNISLRIVATYIMDNLTQFSPRKKSKTRFKKVHLTGRRVKLFHSSPRSFTCSTPLVSPLAACKLRHKARGEEEPIQYVSKVVSNATTRTRDQRSQNY